MNWSSVIENSSRLVWHTSAMTKLTQSCATSPRWILIGLDIGEKQSFVVRPMLKVVAAYQMGEKMREEWNSEQPRRVRLLAMGNLLVFDAAYAITPLFTGLFLMTDWCPFRTVANTALMAVVATLPITYGTVVVNQWNRGSFELADSLHQTTYDALFMLMLSSCSVLESDLFGCKLRSFLIPLTGWSSALFELLRLRKASHTTN